jgi:protein-S-isoprenylcysteine O-methyltransferase Ste14
MNREDLSGEHPYGDIGQIIAFVIFLPIWIIDSFVFRLSMILADYLPIYLQLILAALFFVLAGYFVRSAHQVIFNKVRTPSQVISNGVFSRIRHPMYLGVILFYLGLFFITFSLLSLAFLVIIFLFYDHIASFEEKQLEHKIGKEYISYKETTPKWLPRFKS